LCTGLEVKDFTKQKTYRLLSKKAKRLFAFSAKNKNEVFKLSALAALWQNISAKQKKKYFLGLIKIIT
jgi:hypothetical protein